MNSPPDNIQPTSPEANIKNILEWLALAFSRTDPADPDELNGQLRALRETPVPNVQRIRCLDLLYSQTERIVNADLGKIRLISLPASRKIRQRTRSLLNLLETLTQDYFNTLAELFDPKGNGGLPTPTTSVRRAMEALTWQIRINHLLASPPKVGLWQQLHAAFRTARRLGLETLPGPRNGPSIQRIYLNTLLAAIAQPASFSSTELEFITAYIGCSTEQITLTGTPSAENKSLFWIDLNKDFPAHALVRRIPAADIDDIIYFSCDEIAQAATRHYNALKDGIPPSALGLPAFAGTHTGKSTLMRLVALWGQPSKRKFSRRRQAFRINLCSGLNSLWQLFKSPAAKIEQSEWMVTNESPDGYSLMHISGHVGNMRIGDIVALQPLKEGTEALPAWQICIIRWAISENSEHIELGLELLATNAIAVEIAHPRKITSGSITALLLPAMPPLRTDESLVVPAGLLKEDTHQVIVMVENKNLEIRELHATRLSEQTSIIEIFSVLPDDSA